MEIIIGAIILIGSLVFTNNIASKNSEVEKRKSITKVIKVQKMSMENAAQNKSNWNDYLQKEVENKNSNNEYVEIESKGDGSLNNPYMNVFIKSVKSNRINTIISAKVDDYNYMAYFPINKVSTKEQIPLLYAFDAKINNTSFLSYSYDKYNSIKGCVTMPNLLIDFTKNTDISNIKFKIPTHPCSSTRKKISVSFEEKAKIRNVNFIDSLYAEKGVEIHNAKVKEIILATNAIEKSNGQYNIEKNKNYHFPKFKKFKINKISSQKEMFSSKYAKTCDFGEVLYIGNGTLRSLDIKQGCSGVVLEGDNYNIGRIRIHSGVKTQIKFSKNVQINVKKLDVGAFSSLYLTSTVGNTANIVIKSENIKIGNSNDEFMSSILEEKAGNAKLNCTHPGTCLYDTNKLFVLSDSYISGDIIARSLLLSRESEINGHVLAKVALVRNSDLSNIIKDNEEQIINPLFLNFFEENTDNSHKAEPIIKQSNIKECYNMMDCKRLATDD